jgi:kynurenine formamidase
MTTENDDIGKLFHSLSNWGRWGEDDQLGTLNYLTAATRRDAARLVQDGELIGLGRTLSPRDRPEVGSPMLHFMTQSGDGAPESGQGMASDWIGLEFHGYGVTHLDALSHVFWDRRMYNDVPATRVDGRRGATVASVEVVKDGVLGRGVLLDVPRTRRILGSGRAGAIQPEELDACCREQGCDVRQGDILLVRGGRDDASVALPPEGEPGAVRPGMDVACIRWIHDRAVSVLGSDGVSDARPSGIPGVATPIHAIGISAMGLWLIDNLYLEDLAARCAASGRWQFCFMMTALRIKNGTGSPVNPMAIF